MIIQPVFSLVDYLVLSLIFFGLYVSVVFLLIFLEKRDELDARSERIKVRNIQSLTVLIPSFNEEKTIKSTLDSLLKTKHVKKLDIIVVDDGSTDDTAKRVREYKGGTISLIQKQNSGKASSINYALEKIQDELVLIIDADTYLDEDAIGIMYEYLEKSVDVVAVIPTVKILEPKNFIERMQEIEYSIGNILRRIQSHIKSFSLIPACALVKTDILKEHGGFNEDTLTEDLEMGLRMKTKKQDINHATEAIAYTNAPKTLKSLEKQRLRWQYGGYENIFKYKKLLFSKEHAEFGLFGFPTYFLSRFITVTLLILTIMGILKVSYTHITNIYLLGLKAYLPHLFQTPNITFPISPIPYLIFTGFLINTIFYSQAIKYTKTKKDITGFLTYIIFFWMILAFFSLKGLLLFIIRTPPGWKTK